MLNLSERPHTIKTLMTFSNCGDIQLTLAGCYKDRFIAYVKKPSSDSVLASIKIDEFQRKLLSKNVYIIKLSCEVFDPPPPPLAYATAIAAQCSR